MNHFSVVKLKIAVFMSVSAVCQCEQLTEIGCFEDPFQP